MNKRALLRRLDRVMQQRGYLCKVVVTLRCPAQIPRWSPGPEWIEAATGFCWIKPWWNGEHEVMVYTYDRDAADRGEYREVLVSGRIERDGYLGTFVDKPHRIYGRALSGTLRVQQALPGATTYYNYARHFSELFRREAYDSAYSFNEEIDAELDVHPRTEIAPAGDAWMLTIGCLLDTRWYSRDLEATGRVVKKLAQDFGAEKTYITRHAQEHLTGPLWSIAMKALKNVEEGR